MGGGRGTRLYPLTKYRCKPAVPLAGKYRLVDIPISNCINSGFDSIYLLSQFNTASLHKHIQQTYKFDSFGNGFVDILAAEQTDSGGDWYQGTADAVRKNMHHFERHGEVCHYLILSGDQLYQMNFKEMLNRHIANNADITIAAKPMPKSEAPSLGVMRVNDNLEIVEFAEKPKDEKVINSFLVGDNLKHNLKDPNADYCLASMGIYIFKWSVLKEFLEADEADPTSENDFGKNIIPALLNSGHRLFAYQFDGYWKDVGTISSLWEANMDLLGKHPAFDIYGPEGHKIYARNTTKPASYIAKSAELHESFVADGCEIYGMIDHSVISTGCTVGKGAEVVDSVIMPDVVIENGVSIRNAIIAEGCVIRAGAKIGGDVENGERRISVIGKEKVITEGAVIEPGAII